MSAVFLKILNMSITAGWLILAVILLRALLKKAPKWVFCLLWGLVALRLVCPVSLESVLSLIPSRETIPGDIARQAAPSIHSGISLVDKSLNPVIAEKLGPGEALTSANPLKVLIPLGAALWAAGILILLIYAFISYIKLRRSVAAGLPLEKHVYVCDQIKAPFILGFFRPRIYLPSSLGGKTLKHVLAHELAHLRRRDHLWKPLGFLLLALHWFNPLCWLAYILLCRDIEGACDEKVIRDMDREQLADYSQALLDMSFPRRRIAACPLAFGEVGVKERVKGILNYKKPAFWVLLAAVLASGALAVCLMTDPPAKAESPGPGAEDEAYLIEDKSLSPKLNLSLFGAILEHYQSGRIPGSYSTAVYDVLGIAEKEDIARVFAWVCYGEFSRDDSTLFREVKLESAGHFCAAVSFKKNVDIDGNAEYELLEYWEPRDGSLLAGDIKAKFPPSLVDQAFDHSGQGDRMERCFQAAREAFRVEYFAPGEIEALREKYPEYFDVSTAKGLEVYVWQFARDSYSFGLLPGTDREKTWEEIFAMAGGITKGKIYGLSLRELKAILSTYSIKQEHVVIIPWQHPLSSYIGEYWIAPANVDLAEVRMNYISRIRRMIFGGYFALDGSVNP